VACVPEARGSVTISGSDPDAAPLIDPDYLGAEADVERIVDGIEVARRLASTDAFAGWNAREVLPGPDATSRDQLREFAATGIGTYYHPVGTCAMGTGPDAVVDPQLRVHGLQGIRVVDASVMPRRGLRQHQRATIMIAEKAADLIKESRD
jgi:choline dehydrogenase